MFLYPKLNVEPINVKNKNRNNRMDPENSCSIGHGVASVTRLGNFWKVGKFSNKFSQNILQLFGQFWKHKSKQLSWLDFLQLTKKIWLLFIPASGHIGRGPHTMKMASWIKYLIISFCVLQNIKE